MPDKPPTEQESTRRTVASPHSLSPGALIPDELIAASVVFDLCGLALASCVRGGLYMEFGVADGRSLRAIRNRLPQWVRLYGFDSFYGLPEPWREMPVGTFATSYRITLPNTVIVEGRFEDTLPAFAARHREHHVSFMHVDCDLYSSSRAVLSAFAQQIVAGTVIMFDELFGYDGYEKYEWRAWREFVEESGMRFEVLARWEAFRAVVRML